MTDELEFRLLNVFEVRRAGIPLDIGARKLRELLALLLLADRAAVSMDRIELALWPEQPPKDPSASIHVYISQLRSALGDATHGLVERTSNGYRIRNKSQSVDLQVFDRLVDSGLDSLRRDQPEETLRTLDEALSMIKGEPLPDFATSNFAGVYIDYVGQRRRSACEARLEAMLALGFHSPVIAEARRLLNDDPFDESIWACLLRALYLARRRTEALRTYQTVLSTLGDAGLEPTPGLVELEAQILAQDPALLPAATQPPSNLPALVNGAHSQDDVDMIVRDLRTNAVVTVVGASSVTRPALIQAGRRSREGFADGLWLVELSEGSGDQLLAQSILDTLGIIPGTHPAATLSDLLDNTAMLLLITGVGGVASELSWLAEQIASNRKGARLLVSTAKATARAPGLIRRLQEPATPASPPSAKTAVDVLLSRMQVFKGPATLEAIRQVTGFEPLDAGDVDYMLSQLVADESVTLDSAAHSTRFLLAESASPSVAVVSEIVDRHIDYYRRVSQRTLDGLDGPGRTDLLLMVEAEHHEMRTAIDNCFEFARLDDAFRIARASGHYWATEGSHLGRCITVLSPLAENIRDASADAAGLCLSLGFAHFRSGSYGDASNNYDRAVQMALSADDPVLAGKAFVERSHLRMFLGNQSGAAIDLREAQRLAERASSPALHARTLMLAAQLKMRSPGQADTGDNLGELDEAVRIYERLRHQTGLANSLLIKSSWYIDQGNPRAAVASSNRALEAAQAGNDESMLSFALVRSGESLYALGERASARMRAFEAVRRSVDTGNWLVAALALLTIGLTVEQDRSDDEQRAIEAFVALRHSLGVPLTGRESAWMAQLPDSVTDSLSRQTIGATDAKSVARRLAEAN